MDFGSRSMLNLRICWGISMQSLNWSCCKRRAALPSEQPALMIRATRSRSRRPNHLRSQIGSPKVLSPVSFCRFPSGLHSVAKQAPFHIAFRVDFGSENCPKINEISSFGALRFASAFRAGKSLISGGPQSWKSLVLQSKNKVFRKIQLPPTGACFVDFPFLNCS